MDKPSLNKILGERIRYYRKNNGLSIEQFASMLNKSKSSLSKYERGEILPDIETLYKMTSILHISLMQLLEDNNYFSSSPIFPIDSTANLEKRTFFLYLHSSVDAKRISRNALSLEGDRATFYGYLADYHDISRCRYYYQGHIQNLGTSFRIFLTNYLNPNDWLVIDFSDPLDRSLCIPGFFCCLSLGQYRPFAAKCILSSTPLEDDENLQDLLLPSKEELKKIKNNAVFQVSNYFIDDYENLHISSIKPK